MASKRAERSAAATHLQQVVEDDGGAQRHAAAVNRARGGLQQKQGGQVRWRQEDQSTSKSSVLGTMSCGRQHTPALPPSPSPSTCTHPPSTCTAPSPHLHDVWAGLKDVGEHIIQQVGQRVLAPQPRHAQRHVLHHGAGGLAVHKVAIHESVLKQGGHCRRRKVGRCGAGVGGQGWKPVRGEQG